MTEFIGLCALAAVCSSAILLISKGEKELSVLISSVMYILVMIYVISRAGELFKALREQFDIELNFHNADILLKVGGIALISTVASSICDGTGQKGVSCAIEIFAVIEIITLSMPLILDLFSKIFTLFGE